MHLGILNTREREVRFDEFEEIPPKGKKVNNCPVRYINLFSF